MASVVHPASAVELEEESSPGGQSRGQDVRLLQPWKALLPMLVKRSGIVKFDPGGQDPNQLPYSVTVSGMLLRSTCVPAKAPEPMLVTEAGITTEVRLLQPEKAL